MAGKTIEYTLKMHSDGSQEKALKTMQQMNKEKTKLEKSSRTLAQEASQNREYGMSRSIRPGGTGASARDFAQQAEGLGGLVRLYATYAANIFAVSAAFKALSDAMNTTNMVKGMDQLGSVSGRALGTLAKQFEEATGNSISFKESLEAVTKGAVGGLTNKQLLDLGKYGAQASRILGRDTADSIGRLTRAITKQEPELIDELGLVSKLEPAYEKYARALGKPISALSTLEKQQAFAVAVLDELKTKYGTLDLPTNPYDKLLASLKNISLAGLELVNKVLSPLISLLSESPTALAGILAMIGVKIVSQAIPAIGQYRQQLQKTAEISKKIADQRAEEAKAAQAQYAATYRAKIDQKAEDATERLVRAEARFKKLSSESNTLGNKALADLLAKKGDVSEFNKEDLKFIKQLGEANRQNIRIYQELASSIKLAQKAQEDFLKQDARLRKQEISPSLLTTAGRAADKAEAARRKASSLAIISNVGEQAGILNIGQSFSDLNKQVKQENLGILRGTFTRVAGGANILLGALGSLSGILARVNIAAAVIYGAFQGLELLFSNNGKAIEELTKQYELNEGAVKNATETAKRYDNIINIDAIIARSNALKTLTDQNLELVNSIEVFNKTSTGAWDTIVQNVLGIFNLDQSTKSAEQLADNWLASLKVVGKGEKGQQIEEEIKRLLGIKTLGKDELVEGIKKAGMGGRLPIAKAVADQFKGAGLDKEAEKVGGIKQALDELSKAYGDFSNKLKDTSPQATLLEKTVSAISELQKGLSGGAVADTTLATLKEVLKDSSKLQGLSPSVTTSILDAADAYTKLDTSIKDLEAKKKVIDIELKYSISGSPLEKIKTDQRNFIDNTLNALRTAQIEQVVKIQESLKQGFGEALQRLELGTKIAAARSSITVQEGLLSYLPKSAGTAQLTATLEQEKISLQRLEIKSQYDLVKAIDLDRISREKRSAEESLKTEKDPVKILELQKIVNSLESQLLQLNDPAAFRKKYGLAADGKPPVTSGAPYDANSPTGAQAIMKNLAQGANIDLKGAFDLASRYAAMQSKLVGLAGPQELARIKGIIDGIANEGEASLKDLKQTEEKVKAERAAYLASPEFFAKTPEDQAREVTRINIENLASDLAIKNKEFTNAIKIYDKLIEQITTSKLIPDARKKEFITEAEKAKEITGGAQKAETGVFTARKRAEEDKLNREEYLKSIDKIFKLEELALTTGRSRQEESLALQNLALNTEDQRISRLAELNRLTADEQNLLKQNNELARTDLELRSAIFAATSKFQQEELRINKRIAEGAGGAELDQLLQQSAENRAQQSAAINLAQQTASARKQDIALTYQQTDAQKKFTDFATKGFESMGDALADFAMTGKLNFKSLIDSMIADFIRMMLRIQMQKLAVGSTGPEGWIGKLGATLFGSSPSASTVAPASSSTDVAMALSAVGLADGGAFDSGIQKFAKGGTFTNSIVHSPTLFKFAKGTGLMGEAGPEAIMPLTRDNTGRLGVHAQGSQPSVDVVVNNYSNQHATTKETKDSRGNRRIEVIVGDINAGEMSRPGSQTQQSLRNNFGLQPTLTRR